MEFSIIWVALVALLLMLLGAVVNVSVQQSLNAKRKNRETEEYLLSWFKGLDLCVLKDFNPNSFTFFFLKTSGQFGQIDGLGKFKTYLESDVILPEDRPKAWFIQVKFSGGKLSKYGIGFRDKDAWWWTVCQDGIPDPEIVIKDTAGGRLRFEKVRFEHMAAHILNIVTTFRTKDRVILTDLGKTVEEDEAAQAADPDHIPVNPKSLIHLVSSSIAYEGDYRVGQPMNQTSFVK